MSWHSVKHVQLVVNTTMRHSRLRGNDVTWHGQGINATTIRRALQQKHGYNGSVHALYRCYVVTFYAQFVSKMETNLPSDIISAIFTAHYISFGGAK